MYEIEIKGLDDILAQFKTLVRTMPHAVDEAMDEWAKETRAALKGHGYPAAPPPRKGRRPYHRTGRLANSYFSARKALAHYQIANSADYASYVIGDEEGRQAWMHLGRWYIARSEIEKSLDRLVKKCETAVEQLIRGLR